MGHLGLEWACSSARAWNDGPSFDYGGGGGVWWYDTKKAMRGGFPAVYTLLRTRSRSSFFWDRIVKREKFR